MYFWVDHEVAILGISHLSSRIEVESSTKGQLYELAVSEGGFIPSGLLIPSGMLLEHPINVVLFIMSHESSL